MRRDKYVLTSFQEDMARLGLVSQDQEPQEIVKRSIGEGRRLRGGGNPVIIAGILETLVDELEDSNADDYEVEIESLGEKERVALLKALLVVGEMMGVDL